VTLEPFQDLGDPKLITLSSGTETLTYLTIFGLSGLSGLLLLLRHRLPFGVLATKANVLLLGWLIVSVVLSSDVATSGRRFILAFTTFMLAAMLPWLTRGLRQFTTLILTTAATVVGLSYLGVMLVPHLTIHQPTDLIELDIAGDWRGIYGHKNVAASMMAIFVYFGWFVARAGRPLAGYALAATAFIFLLNSGGKSASGMVFIVAIIAYFVARAHSFALKALIAFGPLALISFLTVGSVVSDTARTIVAMLPVDATFTGRTEIWDFALNAIKAHPWKGQGFEAFWYSENVRYGAEDSTKWMVDVATSHNSYVDLVLTIGLPGLAVVILAFMVMPLRDFHHARENVENQELSRLFLVLWLFLLYLGTFEAFFLKIASPLWFVLALTVCGLRYTAAFEVRDDGANVPEALPNA
jgi:O-antigen ligase